MTAAVVTNIWLGVPFMMVIMLGGLQSIPEDVYEAAVVDGASRVQKFFTITMPLLKPIALPAVLLGVIWTFNMFNVIYLVTGGGPYHRTEILVTYAYKQAFENWNFGLASTYGVIIMMILMIFTFFYRRIANCLFIAPNAEEIITIIVNSALNAENPLLKAQLAGKSFCAVGMIFCRL
jgi:arabinogalactan oligomer/maltooligosaccharide transport system permease protein